MTHERVFRSEAIVLSRTDFGEADRLLVLFTPRHGKLRAIAKGARKPTTRKSGHVELYARTDLLLHRGRDLLIISQAEMTEAYLPLREDLTRTAYASYCVELLDRFTTDEDDSESAPLFGLLDATLRRICTDSDQRLIARFYELRLLDIVGFRPDLARCSVCGEPVTPRDQFFSPVGGGIVCPECELARRRGEGETAGGSLLPVSQAALHALRALQREAWERVAELRLAGPLHAELERLMLAYLVTLLERRLQSVDFIRRLRMSE